MMSTFGGIYTHISRDKDTDLIGIKSFVSMSISANHDVCSFLYRDLLFRSEGSMPQIEHMKMSRITRKAND